MEVHEASLNPIRNRKSDISSFQIRNEEMSDLQFAIGSLFYVPFVPLVVPYFLTGCRPRNCCRVLQASDIPAEVHEPPLPVSREDPIGEPGELGFEVLIAHRVVQTTHGVFDKFIEPPAVFSGERN